MPLRNPLPPRRRPFGALAAVFVAVGCVTAGSADKGSVGPNNSGPDGSVVVIPQDAAQKADSTDGLPPSNVSPLCGTVNIDCGRDSTGTDNTPDDITACTNFDGGLVGTGGATFGAGGASGLGGNLASGGVTGNLVDAGILDAGDGSLVSSLDSGLVAHQLALPTPVGTVDAGPAYACQIASTDNGVPVRRCERAGSGGIGAPCAGPSDCQAGMACVGTQGAGQCRPYCCEGSTQCGLEPSDLDGGHTVTTYCGQRPLLEGSGKQSSLLVPVCIPADGCRLDQPYPCTTGDCTCPSGAACTVVGYGTTSCVTPGTGTLGDACSNASPCAWGYYCSASSHTCEKICKTSGMDLACAPGQCQATAGFPDGFGLCVGSSPTR